MAFRCRAAAVVLAAAVALAALTACSATLPLTVTVNNKTLIPQVRGWEPGNPFLAAGAAKARAVAIANATVTSPNPFGTLVNETVSTVRGKERYMKRTVAAAFGKGNTTTLLTTVILGAAAATDLVCIVDPKTGQLVGIRKTGTSMCSMAGNNVTVPTAKGYISQIKVAYSYDGATIGRLVFEVKTAPNATALRYACGTAGGKAFDLLPKNYALTSLGVSCATAADLAGGAGRKLSQTPPTGLSAGKLAVEAGPVYSLEAEVAKLAAMGFSGVGFALGVDLYNSALPKPPPLSSVFKSENTSIATSAVAVSDDGSKLFALLAQDPYTLATSTDGGTSFVTYHSPMTDAIADNGAWALTVDCSGDGSVLLAANEPFQNATLGVDDFLSIYYDGDAWISRDGGTTFTEVNLPERTIRTEIIDLSVAEDGQTMIVTALALEGNYVDISQEPSRSEYQFVEDSPGTVIFWISSDGGSTWTRKGVAKSDNGLGWQVSNESPRPLQITPDGSRLYLVQDLLVKATIDDVTAPTFVRSTLVYSDNQGDSWQEAFTSSVIYDFATGGGNGETIVILQEDGASISKDGGTTFVPIALGEEGDDSEFWNTVEISRNGEYIALASEGAYYFAVSYDAGESFDQLPVDPSYWTISGVSDQGGITAFDGDFFLWTQDAPSEGGSQLETTPSRAKALASASSSSPEVAPALFFPGFDLLFNLACDQVSVCDEGRGAIQNTIRSTLGIKCSQAPNPIERSVSNFITNYIVGFFVPVINGVCPIPLFAQAQALAIEPFRFLWNPKAKQWEKSYKPKSQLKPGDKFVFSNNFPDAWLNVCTKGRLPECYQRNICDGKPLSECVCYNDGSCSLSYGRSRNTCTGASCGGGSCPPGATCPQLSFPPVPQVPTCPSGRCVQNACCNSVRTGRTVCCPNCFGGGSRPPYGRCADSRL